MTLTTQAMEWLDQNSRRSYPMERDGWRERVSAQSGLDCVLLDALVVDVGATKTSDCMFESIHVTQDETRVSFSYGDHSFSVLLRGGSEDGDGSIERIRINVYSSDAKSVSATLVFSSHARIVRRVGEGSWTVGARVMPTRVVCVTGSIGVSAVFSNGSSGVEGFGERRESSGRIRLHDGFRTSPVVSGGRVLVRVGRGYGHDPCTYDFGPEGTTDCRKPLFYFCGQNAVNSGNVMLKGGPGVIVSQGRTYRVRSGTCAGKTIPCIEIAAAKELLNMYRPA